MTLRRRLALWLDPDLAPSEPEPLRLDLFRSDWRVAGALDDMTLVLRSIDRKIGARRPRIIECAHPELHPADAPFDESEVAS